MSYFWCTYCFWIALYCFRLCFRLSTTFADFLGAVREMPRSTSSDDITNRCCGLDYSSSALQVVPHPTQLCLCLCLCICLAISAEESSFTMTRSGLGYGVRTNPQPIR